MINAISIKGSPSRRTFFSTRKNGREARERVRKDRFVGMQSENVEYLAPRSLNHQVETYRCEARRRRRRTNLSHGEELAPPADLTA